MKPGRVLPMVREAEMIDPNELDNDGGNVGSKSLSMPSRYLARGNLFMECEDMDRHGLWLIACQQALQRAHGYLN